MDRERERIRIFREREERKHLLKKRHWLEVKFLSFLIASISLPTLLKLV